MSHLLFIYGTLHPDRAPAEIALTAGRLVARGRGTIRARLYNFGSYPGVILDNTASEVLGEVFLVPDDAALAALDAYEDFHPDDPAGSLFLRTKAVVTFDNGSQELCWIYVYNQPLP